MGLFKRPGARATETTDVSPPPTGNQVTQEKISKYPSPTNPSKRHVLPTWHHEGRLHTKGIQPDGESGRSGIHPYHFVRVAWRSATPVNTWLNLLWPFVPAAIVMYAIFNPNTPAQIEEAHAAHEEPRNDHHALVFALCYVAMVPPASLLGFAGQELARKLPRVAGILIETMLGGVVEIILFTVLIVKSNGCGEGNLIPVVQAAIIGSIIANLLFCLGSCFLVGGLKWTEQKFHPVVSEAGSGLMLVAGFALLIPSAYFSALNGAFVTPALKDTWQTKLHGDVVKISRGTAIILIVSFVIYILWSTFSHDSIFDEVLREDEERDNDRERDLARCKFTLSEAIFAIVLCLACISVLSVFLVSEIEPLVTENGVPDNFLGLILLPFVEKFAEHLTAIDEAYDNQINFALYHCLGPSIQTALFNAPLVVIIGWGLNKDMDLNFEIFMIVLVVLSILVVGNFLRDGSSNYLEGALLLIVYLIIALTTFYYPNARDASTNGNPLNVNCPAADTAGEGETVAAVARSIAALVH